MSFFSFIEKLKELQEIEVYFAMQGFASAMIYFCCFSAIVKIKLCVTLKINSLVLNPFNKQ